jgi:hypothetical protein
MKFIAVDFSQRDISKESNGFSQKSRHIILLHHLAKANLPEFYLTLAEANGNEKFILFLNSL